MSSSSCSNRIGLIETEKLEIPVDENEFVGPTKRSYWLSKNRIAVGCSPSRAKMLQRLIEQGEIRVFVNLMTQKEVDRDGGHYFERKVPNFYCEKRKKEEFHYHFHPIYDMQTCSDQEALELVNIVLDHFNKGRKIYIHCRGGHGRSGVIAALLIFHLYKLDSWNTLELLTKMHKTRKDVQENYYTSPQTSEQKNQVYRIISALERSSEKPPLVE
mmetsp:Transcript_1953/g.2794  ORF Transcript_1953/g.2794 Transcript_1953/m.2794 type:complete len:215 (+) Transcript_1953:116-760(+)